jgi:hypothetical protein
MRNSYCIIFAVLLVVIAAPCPQADTFTFTCTTDGNNPGGACVEAAPTAPNVTFQGPTLEITWYTAGNPSPFDITLPTDWHDTDSFFWIASNNMFGISDGNHPFDIEATAAINTNLPGFGGLSELGTLSFALGAVAAPEPGTSALMLLGIGLVLMMRKRIARGLPQAT